MLHDLYINTIIYIYIRTHIYIRTYIYIYIRTYIYIHAHVYLFIYFDPNIYIYTQMNIYIYYKYVYSCVFIFIYFPRDSLVKSPQWEPSIRQQLNTNVIGGGVWNVHNFCETCTSSVKRAQPLANVDNFYGFDDKFSNTAKSS